MKQKGLISDLLDVGVAAPFAGASISMVEASPLPSPIKGATSDLIAIKYFKNTAKKLL
jgi:hypothetical protein